MKKILIVNDSPTISQALAKELSAQLEAQISYATDGTQAVALAKEELPDLIFMDIVMRGLNGFQATKAIKEEPLTAEIPIVGLLQMGKDDAINESWMRRVGALAFIYYPFDQNEIISLLKNLELL
jgi:twitching motility two-component system response regulator PilH